MGRFHHQPLGHRPQEPLSERFQKHFLEFEGRIGRLHYLSAILFPIYAGALLWGVSFPFGLIFAVLGDWTAWPALLLFIASLIAWGVLSIWVSLAAGVRRCHDLGLSGWMLLCQFIPFFGWFFQIYLLVWPGQKGANEYG